jgi:sigma-B regulation protein RsbU (phosphoserine phosphatase)
MSTLHYEEQQRSMLNAQQVQQGLLPKKRHFERLFTDSFSLYLPQNILSGDFYWLGTKHNMRYLIIGDCTGHGVSASLTSVLAMSLFEYAIMNKGIKKTTKILSEVNKRYTESFKMASGIHDRPWIDISIICIDDKLKKIFYSSANRKMLFVRNSGDREIFKPKGRAIGNTEQNSIDCFETITIDFENGDQVYLGSDGFQDQFGGPKDKKYGSPRLHDFLSSNYKLSFADQKELLENELSTWKGENSQIDDICIVGVRL